jgi:hypothetical protein
VKSLERSLIDRVKAAIRQQLSARHVPEVIVQVPDIPVSSTQFVSLLHLGTDPIDREKNVSAREVFHFID